MSADLTDVGIVSKQSYISIALAILLFGGAVSVTAYVVSAVSTLTVMQEALQRDYSRLALRLEKIEGKIDALIAKK